MNDCIEVDPTLARDKDGYGRGEINVGGRRYSVKAHRLAFSQAWGIQPRPDQVVRHTCDNPPCINPLHLMLGSQAENLQDMHSKGRSGWQNKQWTHCINDHEFQGHMHNGKQYCRQCKTEAARRYRNG